MRTKATINRLNMYKNFKAVRNRSGKVIKAAPCQGKFILNQRNSLNNSRFLRKVFSLFFIVSLYYHCCIIKVGMHPEQELELSLIENGLVS